MVEPGHAVSAWQTCSGSGDYEPFNHASIVLTSARRTCPDLHIPPVASNATA